MPAAGGREEEPQEAEEQQEQHHAGQGDQADPEVRRGEDQVRNVPREEPQRRKDT